MVQKLRRGGIKCVSLKALDMASGLHFPILQFFSNIEI